MTKYPGPKKRRFASPSSSECDSSNLKYLDWNNWYQDSGGYIHVKHCNLDDETWHRVYPKTIAGYTCRRIAVYDGIFYWLHDADKPTPKPNANSTTTQQG